MTSAIWRGWIPAGSGRHGEVLSTILMLTKSPLLSSLKTCPRLPQAMCSARDCRAKPSAEAEAAACGIEDVACERP
jgi:hypothetical protein